jgi:hypothetical protein
MLRHLALAALSCAIVAVAVFPYWVAVERLEQERSAAALSVPLRVSLDCPVAEVRSVVATRTETAPSTTR